MKELKDEISRLHTENALLKAGYDAARLEINHLRGVTKVVAPAQPVAWLVYLPSEDAQRIYDSQDDIGYVDDLTNNADAKVIPLYTAQPSAAAAAKAPAAPTGWYALAADGMATLCVDRDDAESFNPRACEGATPSVNSAVGYQIQFQPTRL